MSPPPLRLRSRSTCTWLAAAASAFAATAAPAASAPVAIEVRALAPAELPPDTADEWLKAFLGPGIAAGALGAVAPPLYASGLVVGGLLLVPGALVMSHLERSAWQEVVTALVDVDLEAALRAAVARRAAALGAREGPSLRVELLLRTYGVVGLRPEKVCFVADAELHVERDGERRVPEPLAIGLGSPTPDAPPPQCASVDRFAHDDARLVRDTAAEYAEVLAAMTIARLQAPAAP